MTIVRIKKEKNYTMVDNAYLNDLRLTARELGLLTKVLSLPDDWEFSVRGLERILKDGQDGIRSALRVLEETGYLVRSRARNEHGKMGKITYTFYERSLCPSNPDKESPDTEEPNMEKPDMVGESQLITNRVISNNSNTYPINQDGVMADRAAQEEAVRNNIDYSSLVIRNPHNVDQINEMVAIMADVMMMPNNAEITVGGNQLPAGTVKSQLCRLGTNHIEYVLDSMSGSAAPIRNIHGYLLTALYRAPLTLHNHYAAQVACDDMTAAEGDITS